MSGEMAWHKRNAIHIVAQLPDDPKDALIVLALARALVTGFLQEGAQPASLSASSTEAAAARSLDNIVPLRCSSLPDLSHS